MIPSTPDASFPFRRTKLAYRPFCTRLLCETVKFCGHGQSPLWVGPCVPFPLSHPGTPWLHPHYQASRLLWVPPTSGHHRPLPRFLHSLTGAHLLARQRPDLLGYRIFAISGSTRPRTPGVPSELALALLGLSPADGSMPSALTKLIFGAQHLHGRHHPLPLHLACFRAYASISLLPV